MDIRIEKFDGDPPTWKVFLGTFFHRAARGRVEVVTCREAGSDGHCGRESRHRLSPAATLHPRALLHRDGLSAVAHEALAEDRALLLGGEGDAG
jgi:hypothetical protein